MMGGMKTMAEKIINIAADFSKTPGGRYLTDGPASGEDFRERLLIPALKDNQTVIVELDGTRGYPSSFLEEAFGGLVRKLDLSQAEFAKKVHLKASSAFSIYVQDIENYVKQTADARLS